MITAKRVANLPIVIGAIFLAVSVVLQIVAFSTHTSGFPGSLTSTAIVLAYFAFPFVIAATVLKRRSLSGK